MALASAALFGVSAPLSKLLLPATGPLVLSALLYLGAGLTLSAARLRRRHRRTAVEAPLVRADLGLLAGIIGFGGVLGPLLLLIGLGRLSGLAGSLLLNLEAPFTIGMAVVLFREHLDRRALAGTAAVVAGAAIINWAPGQLGGDWIGGAAIAGACLAWALDNNFTQRLSLRDPVSVVQVKALGAASCTLLLAVATGQELPPWRTAVLGAGLGAISYGLSLVLAVAAMRRGVGQASHAHDGELRA